MKQLYHIDAETLASGFLRVKAASVAYITAHTRVYGLVCGYGTVCEYGTVRVHERRIHELCRLHEQCRIHEQGRKHEYEQ